MASTSRRIPQITERLFLALAALVVAAIGIFAYSSNSAFRTASEQADETRGIVDTTNSLLSSLKDAETGQRGFLLTGEERYLEPYQRALAEIPPGLNQLTAIEAAHHHPEDKARIDRLRPLVTAKLAELAETIAIRRNQGAAAALDIVRTDRGKAAMDEIRRICAEIQTASYGYLQKQTANARTSATSTAVIAVAGSAGLFVLLMLATLSIERATYRRHELITALEEREVQLRESHDWLRTTLASIGDAVITTDATGRITLLNPVAQAVTGWTQEDAAGKPLEQVFVIRNEGTGKEVENPAARALREGRVVGLANHTVLLAKDGRRVPIDDSAAPIRDAHGNINGVVLVFRDISERKKAEQEVLRAVEDLRVSNTALLRANEDLNQFAFAASHDLQEPLRMVTSYSQLLVRGYRGQLDGEAATCVRFITEGTKRMSDLLSDLLAYTQITGGRDQAGQRIDLNHVIEVTLVNCKPAIDETSASVTSDPLPVVQGHEADFIQIFQNLISNSLKYRSERPPQIHVSSEKRDGHLRLSVRDNGIGIAPQYHTQIFGVFKRLHGRSIPGTGIGLAICQRVVQRYGGAIWVESNLDQGATFYFTLPAAEKDGPASEG